jgi:hypothetical protein
MIFLEIKFKDFYSSWDEYIEEKIEDFRNENVN